MRIKPVMYNEFTPCIMSNAQMWMHPSSHVQTLNPEAQQPITMHIHSKVCQDAYKTLYAEFTSIIYKDGYSLCR